MVAVRNSVMREWFSGILQMRSQLSLVVHSGSRDQLLTRSSQNEATESVV